MYEISEHFNDWTEIWIRNRALSLLHPYDALTSCKKLEKANVWSLRYSKMGGRTDQQTDRRTDGWTNEGSTMVPIK